MINEVSSEISIINIERNIICTLLEGSFVNSEVRAEDIEINKNYFTLEEHRVIINGINRLKELNEPVDSDMIRLKFSEANRWNARLESALMNIMLANLFGSKSLFSRYYSILENNYKKTIMINEIRNI